MFQICHTNAYKIDPIYYWMTFKQDNNWRKVRFCIEQTLIVSFSGLSAAQPLDRRVFNEYYYICIIHKTDLQKVCYLKHVRLSNHFVLIFLLLDDVALGHPDVVVVDSELMLSTRKKVGHLATSRTCAFLLWLSSFFLYLLSEDLSTRGGPPRTKRTFTTRQHTCSCSGLVLHFSPTNMLLIGNNSKLFSDRTFENSGWGFWY